MSIEERGRIIPEALWQAANQPSPMAALLTDTVGESLALWISLSKTSGLSNPSPKFPATEPKTIQRQDHDAI
jgi:hypothetical protein